MNHQSTSDPRPPSRPTIAIANSLEPAPPSWVQSGWQRPWNFLAGIENPVCRKHAATHRSGELCDGVVLWTDVERALARQSLRGSQGDVTRPQFHGLLRAVYRGLATYPAIFAGVVTGTVEGWAAAAWSLETSPKGLHVRCNSDLPDRLSRIGQGQDWIINAQVLFLLGIDWEYTQPLDPDLAYADALVTMGRIGHSILLEGQKFGLRARMTPAVKESAAAELLELDATRDVLYLISVGNPR